MGPMPVAGSARGAVLSFQRARFTGPPSDPGVPVIPAPGSPRGPSPTNGCVAARLRSTRPGLPGRSPVFTSGSCPADPPPPPRCAPSPCARRSRARTTTGTPPRPATNSRRRACPPPEGGEGDNGSLPTFTTTRSTRSVSSYTRQPRQGYAAALPPGLLTGHYLPAAESLAAIVTGMHCCPAHIRQVRGRHVAYGASTLVPRVHLLVLLAGPGPSGSAGPSRRCQCCSHPCVRLHAQAALSFAALLRQAGGGALPSPPGRGSASWRR